MAAATRTADGSRNAREADRLDAMADRCLLPAQAAALRFQAKLLRERPDREGR